MSQKGQKGRKRARKTEELDLTASDRDTTQEVVQQEDDPFLDQPGRSQEDNLDLTGDEPLVYKDGIYNQGYYYGWTKSWNPEWMYRIPGDVVFNAIRNGGSEGKGRGEIGRRLGIDTSSKQGNRRVSANILTVQKENEKHIGQFQKMEGKVRMIKYYWKKSSEPESFQKLFDDFKRLTGRESPFKMGQTVKFPETGLSTLRISDVSFRRITDILEMLSEEAVLAPLHKVLKYINAKELAQGYQFQIDKKSLMKCLLALQKEHFLNIFETIITSDNVENKIQIVTRPHIQSAEDPEVAQSIQRTIDNYHSEGRVFPHGQLRYSLKKRSVIESLVDVKENDVNLQLVNAQQLLENGFSTGISLDQRYSLFRLLTSKSAIAKTEKKPVENAETSLFLDETMDTTVNSSFNGDDSALDLSQTIDEGNDTAPEKENLELANDGDASDDKSTHILLNFNGVLSDGVEDPFAPSRAIPKTLEHLVRKKDLYDPHIEYGFQSKYIRTCALHDIAWHFVYGNPQGRPSVFERYPPGIDPILLPEKPIEQLHVYEDKETPYRFMPPCSFESYPPGWFMLCDLYSALPLSIFCLLCHVPKNIPKDEIMHILSDPIARHIPLADLPLSLRRPIFRDKRNIRQLEHTLFQLCALGLGVLAPNPDPKRFTTPHTSVFYIADKALLYDTSTSERGYAKVSLPIDQYDCYTYVFDSHAQVSLYWQHLRAISQSTSLNFRMEQTAPEINPSRHRIFSLGMFDKSTITWDGDLRDMPSKTPLNPLFPHDGCGGFDSALYLHLKRHWDLNPRPSNVVNWFVSWFRRNGEISKSTIQQRVKNLQRDWNSVVRSLMPSDVELTRKKRVRATTSMTPSTLTMQSMHLEPKVRMQQPPKGSRHKKRPLDTVDILSQQNRLHLRCRFSPKERDMLLLIRAVGFFLNPVYRFWLDPSAVRDIMHEYVPESRTKTIQSLMAAGVRELVRPQRLVYLQRIVCNLNTFKEMRSLRFQLASSPLNTTEAKVKFFKNAFNTANRLLFMESHNLPSTSVGEATFEIFLANGQVIISSEQTRTQTPIPLRSQKPTSLNHIRHCITTNVLLSVLIANAKYDGLEGGGEAILEQLSATDINSTLQVLRADGLLSRPRTFDQTIQYKSQATLSHYFRHFFGHRFHVDIIEQVNQIKALLEETTEGFGEVNDLEDYAGTVLIAADSFYNRTEIDLEVEDALIQMFTEAADQNSTKQIRYLEATDLHLERVHIALVNPDEMDDLPTLHAIQELLEVSIPDGALPARPLEDWLAELDVEMEERKMIRDVSMAIQATEVYGASFPDLQITTNLMTETLLLVLERLRQGFQVIEAGVDTKRYVWNTYADAWTVLAGGKRVCPRPWIQPDGTVCLSTARWMLEALLMAVVNKPGIQKKDLQFRYDFALQPVAFEQLLRILVYCDCVIENLEEFDSMNYAGPFEVHPVQAVVHALEPSVQAIQRFAAIFKDIPPIQLITTGPQGGSQKSNDDQDLDKKNVPLMCIEYPMEAL